MYFGLVFGPFLTHTGTKVDLPKIGAQPVLHKKLKYQTSIHLKKSAREP